MKRVEEVVDAAPAVSGALPLKVKSAFQVVRVPLREYSFVKILLVMTWRTCLSWRRDSALQHNLNLVVSSSPYNNCSARSQVSLAHDVFCKEKIRVAVSSMSNMKDSEARGHVFCSHLVVFHCENSFRRQMEMKKNAEAVLEEPVEKLLHRFEIEDHLFIYKKSPEVYSRDSLHSDLLTHPGRKWPLIFRERV